MKRLSIHPLLYLLLIPLLSLVYALINQSSEQINILYTDLDEDIPFIKAFIIPYMIWMPFLYVTLVYFYIKDRKLYFTTLTAYVVSVLICYVIYLVFQTTVPRPQLAEVDLLSKFVLFVYQNDAPYNCFPSIHCLSSYLLFNAARKCSVIKWKMTTGIGVIALGIIISTLFVKQHVVMDAFAGIMLAHLVYSIVYKFNGQFAVSTRHTIKV